jgi:hypothetical protein
MTRLFYWVRRIWFHFFPRKVGAYGRVKAEKPGAPPAPAPIGALPLPPGSWKSPRLKWGMLGNADLGDCVFAGAAHAAMAVAAFFKLKVTFLAEGVSKWYLNWNHGEDVGTIIPAFLNAWQTDTMTSKPFYGYGAAAPFRRVDPTNIDQVKSCIANFGAVLVGAELQRAQEDQFRRGQRWDYVPGSKVVGGHCVALTGFNDVGPHVVSWGKGFRATWAWVTNVCDEAYTGVFPAALAAQRFGANSLVTLDAYCADLGDL